MNFDSLAKLIIVKIIVENNNVFFTNINQSFIQEVSKIIQETPVPIPTIKKQFESRCSGKIRICNRIRSFVKIGSGSELSNIESLFRIT